ncbi:DUF3304 domain-containing protein [Pseudomonas sp. 10B1]|uniref:DUF3304 domain-containing protein n=1 Tax=unclassified Pseudomonas TaxID=196821 RepID=UPI002B225791|nr:MULTISPECIES: DUF3304 domain-containing protein [unclassified Pseudomonas]MEA9993721.1 DUF3304 domain-containing protein [Pseudomonas sp. AA4]MEB0085062.1 DUF3304 domain-containing protein [Pseudomonas sp. RTI1]MEB0125165.1 DUF3304 domain-containing protein [Pseudomonas sp. CCC1.2]MEB0152056.1 DUF3304 domain-containing protein [Pseudomonas sp. CCC4.3]MEB0220975.1 DUF3304 domain-containing protein [Pseudomonas sp. AB12(2023)]
MSSFMNPGLVRRVPVFLGAAVLAGIALQACSKAPPDRLGAPIEGYNHTSAAINHFDVNGNGGPNIGPFGGGGSQMCCVSMPRKWHPGLTVVVEWEKDPNVGASRYWPEPRYSDAWFRAGREHQSKYTRHRAVVEVAPYEELGVIDVHFLPCDQIAVAAVAELPGKPGYPFSYPRKMEVPPVCPAP